ncbi:hypothetical protein LCGC14_1898400, partial [marine sediment metagenome]
SAARSQDFVCAKNEKNPETPRADG